MGEVTNGSCRGIRAMFTFFTCMREEGATETSSQQRPGGMGMGRVIMEAAGAVRHVHHSSPACGREGAAGNMQLARSTTRRSGGVGGLRYR